MPLSLCQMKVILFCFYSRWWRVLSAGGMWSVGLWLSANLRRIKDSVPPNTLCTERCWKETYSEVKLYQTVHQKLCNGTKNCATASTTVQQHQKLCNMTKHCVKLRTKKARNGTINCTTAPTFGEMAPKTVHVKSVQRHQKLRNGTKNRCSPDYQFGNVKCPPPSHCKGTACKVQAMQWD